ncbi:helix-turn-helix domain-containing protein [Schleiferilactobacillus shenzhenensis]|uniref:HTH cro/C1-type domain-containing protein n=1 Tax=Schleiferilactobacillus shenzhenensis LY-73 TaxID=1231336 RepID=U4TTS4_9LACO|nr:Rgg/GadR/MutR family transcriptional regulator [Schleiferilactobacillus shenzhenensis]ERL65298.1 hypothetical protein L248_2697 [Schleiferilactobacillus shenzhenensis LY-73]
MTPYGAIYRRLRKDKHITLQNVEKTTGISNSLISRFEQGKNDITLSKLLPLLVAIHVSYNEFFFAYQYAQVSASPQPATAIQVALYRQNDVLGAAFTDFLGTNTSFSPDHYDLVADIVTQQTARFHQHPNHANLLALAFWRSEYRDLYCSYLTSHHRSLAELPPDNSTPILRHYLWNVDNWGIYEIEIFLLSATFFTPAENIQLLRTGIKKSQQLSFNPAFRNIQAKLLIDDFTILISHQGYAEANQVLTLIEQLPEADNLGTKVIAVFLRGWLEIASGDRRQGEQACRQSIAIFHRIGSQAQERIWTNRLTEILADPHHSLVLVDLNF